MRSSNHTRLRRYGRNTTPTSAKVFKIDIQDPFASVKCPPDMDEFAVLAVKCYETALNAVTADPAKFNLTMPCAVCGGSGHPFEDCTILKNIDYLRSHYIQYCLQQRRLRRLLEKTKTNVSVNSLQTVSADMESDDEEQDFRSGEGE